MCPYPFHALLLWPCSGLLATSLCRTRAEPTSTNTARFPPASIQGLEVPARFLGHSSGFVPPIRRWGLPKNKKIIKKEMYCVLTCQHLRQVNLLKYSPAAGATADKARPAASRFTTEASTSPATRRAASQLLCFQYFKSDICFLIVFCAYASMQRGESTSVHPVLSRVIDFHFFVLSNRENFFPWILCYYSCKKMTHAGKTPLPLIFFYNIP